MAGKECLAYLGSGTAPTRDAVGQTSWVGWQKQARLAQSVERLALNQVVVGSSPTVGASFCLLTFRKIKSILQLSRNLIFDQIKGRIRFCTSVLAKPDPVG